MNARRVAPTLALLIALFSLAACAGAVAAESRSGDIEVRQAHGALRATTGHGALTAELAPNGGAPQVELTGGGSIDLVLPGDASARVEAGTSAGVIGRVPRRFSNQLEFGTSSNALTFTAAPAGSTAKKRAIGRKTIWFAPSHANGE